MRTWRALLLVVAIAVPAFGGVVLFIDPAGEPAFGMRFAIAAAAGSLLALSYRSPWVRTHLRQLAIPVAMWVYASFCLRAAEAGMTAGHAVSLMLIAAMTTTMGIRAIEIVAYWAFVVGVTSLAYRTVPAPQLEQSLFLAVLTTVVGGMGLVTLARVRLEGELERRVEARTAELAAEVVERRAAEAAALQASRAKSRFLANMSHELRTPLNAIVGYTELVQDELSDLGQDALRADLERVRSSADHLVRMISDVLDLSRIEAGQLEVLPCDVDVAEVVEELVRLVEPNRARSGSTLEIQVAPDTRIHTDPVRLSQIGLNLLTNALKFTDHGAVVVSARRRGDTLELSVSDSGVGIEADALQRVFETFVQVDDSPTRRHQGTGLGLALSRDLAERLGGTLTATSEVGVGSTFTLTLPAA